MAILERARIMVDSMKVWDLQDDRDCGNDPPGHVSMYCLLYQAIEWRMGHFHFRQPALQVVRVLIRRQWRPRVTSHPIMDFNNHPETSVADLRQVLEAALIQARREVRWPKD